MQDTILEIKNLYVEYKSKKNFLGETEIIHALNDISIDAKRGEILSIAGESGCGKSTLVKTITGLQKATYGTIHFDSTDILSQKNLKKLRKKIQMVFQNPYSSLNPKMKIYDILKEPLIINTDLNKNETDTAIKDMINKVGLDESCLKLYPHEFSGGQRQRIAIARALILKPQFLIADEPVSALDVSIQAQIINLLKTLKEDYNLTILFISHDLSIIRFISDRIAIMYLGEIVELGSKNEIFNDAKHPYTKALLNAAPTLDNTNKERLTLEGELPSPNNLPKGCKFHARCPYCMPICKTDIPQNINITDTHYAKCFLLNDNKNL